MTITFTCEHCRKELKAPDEAAGKRGKCPHCGQSSYIPHPPAPEEDDLIPLAPIDEEAERKKKHELEEMRRRERALLAENGGAVSGAPAVPLEHKEGLSVADLQHLIVNYILDMSSSKLDRAEMQVKELRKFGDLGRKAVQELLGKEILEPALAKLPARLIQAFLTELRDKLK